VSECEFASIILAAGMSTRFQGNKLLYKVKGRPLVVHTIEKFVAADMEKIIVVLGRDAKDFYNAIADNLSEEDLSKLLFAFNPNYRTGGMSSSIKVGMRAILPNENVIIHPGDVPFTKVESIKKVVQSHCLSPLPITVACYNGRHAHPIIFKPDMRNELLGISEEGRGLKSVVEKYRNNILCVETGDPGTLRDIDTVEDLESALHEVFGRE